jgi:hypothetical protein
MTGVTTVTQTVISNSSVFQTILNSKYDLMIIDVHALR